MSHIPKTERSIALVAACLSIDDRLVVFPEPVDPRALDPALLRALPGKIRLAAVGDNHDESGRRGSRDLGFRSRHDRRTGPAKSAGPLSAGRAGKR